MGLQRQLLFMIPYKKESHYQYCYDLVHHHLLIYDRTGRLRPYVLSEDQGSHGTFCFYLIDMVNIYILKDRIPSRTLIFMSYDNQGISIIDPVTDSL